MSERMNITGVRSETAYQLRILAQFSGMTLGQSLDFLMRQLISSSPDYWAEILEREAEFEGLRR